MIEKGRGPKLGKLRIIQLAEDDLNFVLKIIWAIGMQGNAVNAKILDTAEYEVPGKACYRAVLSKILFLDISRQTLTEIGIGDLDAMACFDRVVPTMAVITCQ